MSKWRKVFSALKEENTRRTNREQMEVINFNYKWTIRDFDWTSKYRMNSPKFSPGNNHRSKWRLTMYSTSNDVFCLYLILVSLKTTEFLLDFEVSILDSKGEKVNVHHTYNAMRVNLGYDSWGWNSFVKKSYLSHKDKELLPNDRLTILCEVTIRLVDFIKVSDQVSNKLELSECQPFVDLGCLLHDGKFSDVIISVSGKEIRAHKAILSARSPVFAAMFDNEMEENKNNEVEITDLDYDVVQELLKYIYTGTVSNKAEISSLDLLIAADKYSIERLKSMCEDYVSERLCTENAAETLVVADRVNARQLKERTIDFIANHVTEVVETPNWKSMISSHPELLQEAFCTVSKALTNLNVKH